DDGVARREIRNVVLELLPLDLVNQSRHRQTLCLSNRSLSARDLPRGGTDLALEFLEQLRLLGREPPSLEQIRPLEPGPPQRLLEAPSPHRAVIAGEEHLRHAHAVDVLGPRVLRTIEQP